MQMYVLITGPVELLSIRSYWLSTKKLGCFVNEYFIVFLKRSSFSAPLQFRSMGGVCVTILPTCANIFLKLVFSQSFVSMFRNDNSRNFFSPVFNSVIVSYVELLIFKKRKVFIEIYNELTMASRDWKKN